MGSISKAICKVLVALIAGYRYIFSPLKTTLFGAYAHCRFYPTCSQYAIQAISIHGPFKGTALSIKRILRCNPFSTPGYDPVPLPQKHSH